MSSIRTHFTQAAQVASAKPAWSSGVRAAIATVGPLLAGSALGWPNAAWMGLAGFNVALGDKGGLLRTRLGAMLPATFFGALAAVAGALAGRQPVSAVIVFALWAVAAGVARTFGAAATGTGVLSVATLVVSMEQPARSVDAALARGGAILAGSVFAIALSLLLGRFRLYRPARLAVARVYRALAEVAAGERVDTHAVRESIDAARTVLTQLRRGMQRESPRGERLLVLLESADRMSSMITRAQPELAATLRAIAEAVERERSVGALRASGPPLVDTAMDALRELQDGEPSTRVDLRARYLDPLRGTFTWSSAVLRHAMRVAVTGGLAVAVTRALHVDRGYWLTLSVVVVLQPYTSSTVQRGLQRVSGTVAGAVVAALLLSVVHTPVQLMVIVFFGAALTVALLPVNYGLYSAVLTPTFVMLAEVHAIDRHLVWLRVSNTLVGALLAALAAWLLWPASERGRARDDLTAMLRALAELTRCTAECDDRQIEEARRAFSVAAENADASVQRMLSDARVANADEEAMMAMLIYARRYAAALERFVSRPAERAHLAPLARRLLALSVRGDVVAAETIAEPLREPLAGLESAIQRLS